MRYERVTLTDGKVITLADTTVRKTAVMGEILTGTELDRDGDRTHRLRIISTDLIKRRVRLRQNRKYATLEAWGWAGPGMVCSRCGGPWGDCEDALCETAVPVPDDGKRRNA